MSSLREIHYRQHGIQLLILESRVNFETPSGGKSDSWFETAWFTWGLNLPRKSHSQDVVKQNLTTQKGNKQYAEVSTMLGRPDK